ncbi:teichoic acids export ABC transporter ATP-binding subunit TagH [Alkalicoccobacillus gibsonii]|uniref:teichoic acids export ABC transporter ATP-binding subunit TagH n=1 Tax=Alkalicoccobacillus gibsonii TaxID=79881 RepID=UPI00351129CE
MNYKVKLSGVSKQYTLYRTNTEKLLDIITPKSMKKNTQRNFYALRDISLEIKDGETIGVVGINGSGKSTISNILSNVIPPTTGQIDINGEPSLIAINVGLNNNLSGYDNIELKLLMHGFSRNEINQLVPSIEEFADIGDFMNQPVKKYSSGMKSRLGFAISVHTNPDLLIVDEALSVGDKTFYQKCLDKINEFKEQGKTIIFISHSIGQIKSISDRVLWLHNGELKEFGETKTVLENYEEYINWFNKLSNEEKQSHKEELKEKRSTLIAPNQIDKNSQKKVENPYDPDVMPSRYEQKKKRKRGRINRDEIRKLAFPLQLSLFILAFLVSSVFLIAPSLSQTEIKNEEKSEEINAVIEDHDDSIERYNQAKESFVIADEAEVYLDRELTDRAQLQLPFALNILILGADAQSNSYLISTNENEYFIDQSQVAFLDEVEESDLTLQDILSNASERFFNSYQFFLAHLGEARELSSKMNGADDHVTQDNEGNTYINYPFENFTVKYDEDDIATAIIVNTEKQIDYDIDKNLLHINGYNILVSQSQEQISFIKDK